MAIATRDPTATDRASKPLPPLVDPPQDSPLALVLPPEMRKVDAGVESSGDEDESTPTPTIRSLSSSAVSFSSSLSSSPSVSPSSSITTDTSVASDANHACLSSFKSTHEEHNAMKQEKGFNTDGIVPTLVSNTDADLNQAETSTIIPSSSASAPSTPASSSSTSLPVPSPSCSSAPTSASPSTTTINELGVDSNGLLSLLRPRPQMNQNLNVKFAPLPDLAPRKRKSSTPLGMAARSQLARRRKMMYQDGYDDDGYDESYHRPRRMPPPSPRISEEGEMVDGVRQPKPKKKEKKAKKEKESEQPQAEEDADPLASLAKKMGRAGKHFWKKMASGGKGEKEEVVEDEKKINLETVVVVENTTGTPDEQQHSKEEGEQGQGVASTEEDGKENQEPRVQDEAEVEPRSENAPPSSEPQNPTNSTTPTISEDSSEPDSKHDTLPPTPSILVSVS